MRSKDSLSLLWLALVAAFCLFSPLSAAYAQTTVAKSSADVAAKAASAPPAEQPREKVDRSKAYFHAAMANYYEEQAMSTGRPEFVSDAIEEFKNALNADPDSADLSNALADLYMRTGQMSQAEATAKGLLKTHPDNIDAHKMLGRIYLRQLGQSQNSVSSSSPSGNVLDKTIAEYEKIVALEPKNVEDHMMLGQLYSVKHDTRKAEEQFKLAQSIEPDSEGVVLNLARLYAEADDMQHAVAVIQAVPEPDRTARMELALGAAYDQLKQTKDAIAAYKRAADLEPDDVRTLGALAQALLNDNQYEEALKAYRKLNEINPDDAGTLIHIAEIQRRMGKYQEALDTTQKALKKDPDSLEGGFNEGLLLDVLGRYDEAAKVFAHMIDLTSHANGAYTDEEKNNRGIFLERLGSVYHEQNKVDLAIATYQKMIDLGGDLAVRGYQGQVDT
ncbi:MAG TPA: tetratricopeptide repeat protein, partial [Terracidiphilus sp.]|nr:tetratricopeptide repeat protein [Terracidiphilus sp.]